ncbi:histidine--tRNA ligase, partial [archaeon]
GPIFEIVEETKSLVGTITAGGRYDNLIGQFGGVSTPATGISLGIERIVQLVRENNLISIPKTRIFIANVNDKTMPDAIKIVQKLRKENVSCQIDLMGRNLSKQLEYADAAGIPYVIVVGERELKTKKFKLRDMKNKSEKEVSLEEVARLA